MPRERHIDFEHAHAGAAARELSGAQLNQARCEPVEPQLLSSGDNDGHTISPQLLEQAGKMASLDVVHWRKRVVETEQTRIAEERMRDEGAGAHPCIEPSDPRVREVPDAGATQGGTDVGLYRGPCEFAKRGGDIERRPNTQQRMRDRVSRHVLGPRANNRAGIRIENTGGTEQQRGLARTGFTDDSHALASGHAERHLIEGDDIRGVRRKAGAIANGNVEELESGISHAGMMPPALVQFVILRMRSLPEHPRSVVCCVAP